MSTRSGRTRSLPDNRPDVPEDDPASSRASSSSQITSASVLAAKQRDFPTWAIIVGLDPEIRLQIPPGSAFQDIRDIQEKSHRFPTWLTIPDSLQFKFLPDGFESEKDTLCSDLLVAKGLNPEWFHDEDDLPLCGSIGLILQMCHHNRVIRDRPRKPTEMDRRNTVDALQSHICESEKDTIVRYSNEQALKLPEAKFGRYNVADTTSDGVMHVQVTDFKPFLKNFGMQTAATAFTPQAQDQLQFVHCVTEFKRDLSGQNQAMMGMVSAIYQKRVLGVSGQFTFGVFQYGRNFLQVIAGVLQTGESKIKIYDIGSYSLDDPLQAVQFYLVLREIKNIASVYIQALRESESRLTAEVLRNPPAVKWTLLRMDGILEDPTGLNNQAQGAGGSNTRSGNALEQCDASDEVLSYLESIRDPCVFLPVDQPPTPPIDPSPLPAIDPLVESPIYQIASLPMKRRSEDGSDSSSDDFDLREHLQPSAPTAAPNPHKTFLVGGLHISESTGKMRTKDTVSHYASSHLLS